MLLGLHSTKLLLCQTTSHGPRSFVQEQKGNACRREKHSSRLRQSVIEVGAAGRGEDSLNPALTEGVGSRVHLASRGRGQFPAGTVLCCCFLSPLLTHKTRVTH